MGYSGKMKTEIQRLSILKTVKKETESRKIYVLPIIVL